MRNSLNKSCPNSRRALVGHQPNDSQQCCVFVCNVCLDQAREPVITFCGHLFCWPCLYQWLQTRIGRNKICPVCKTQISKSYPALPVYGRETGGGAIPVSALEPRSIPPKPKPLVGSKSSMPLNERFFVIPDENVLRLAILYSVLLIVYYLFA